MEGTQVQNLLKSKTFLHIFLRWLLYAYNNGWIQLHHFEKNGSYEYIKSLEVMGINIHLKTNDGKNCLHIAAAYGHLNLCKTLILKHNFHIYMTDNEGFTALYRSAQSGV